MKTGLIGKIVWKLLRLTSRAWPDRLYLRLCFLACKGKLPRLDHPVTFSEKLQWLKLHDRRHEYNALVDKIDAKERVAQLLGSEDAIIPTIAVYESVGAIDWDSLPQRFVAKCSHNSHTGVVICRNKDTLNRPRAMKELSKGLGEQFYWFGREWPYRDIAPRILIEELLDDGSGQAPPDYKFYCFDGKAVCVMVCLGRTDNGKDPEFVFFDRQWNPVKIKASQPLKAIPAPAAIDAMWEMAERLSKGMAFVRVDLYEINGKIYFGELTFYPRAGIDPDLTPEAEKWLGDLLILPHPTDNQ